jgi:Fe2+ transport system protein FeoA
MMERHKKVTTLDALPVGGVGLISGFDPEEMAFLFLEKGLIPGKKITIIHKSIFGNTMLVRTMDMTFALRGGEARAIQVQTAT